MTIDVQRFESIPGETVLVDAVWAVSPTAGGETRSGRTVAREAAQGKDFDALAAAHSRALATVSARHRRGDPGGGRHGREESANAEFKGRHRSEAASAKAQVSRMSTREGRRVDLVMQP